MSDLSFLNFTKIDFKGHVKSSDKPDSVLTLEEIKEAFPPLYREIKKYDDFVRIFKEETPPIFASFRHCCPNCGENLNFDLKAVSNATVQVKAEPCPHPKGVLPFVLEIDVPSGVMVLGNDFRDKVPLFESETENSSPAGLKDVGLMYEKLGMVHIFVGNSCPEVVEMKNHTLKIRNSGSKSGTRLGSICTDLWWFCAMDEVDYRKQCKRHNLPVDTDLLRIPVQPGRWGFEVDYRSLNEKSDTNGYTYAKASFKGPLLGFKRTEPKASLTLEEMESLVLPSLVKGISISQANTLPTTLILPGSK